MRAGQITYVSAGTLGGIYRPQVRIYYQNDRHGILFETITKPLRCRSRKRAIMRAKEWAKTPEGQEQIEAAKARIRRYPDNDLGETGG